MNKIRGILDKDPNYSYPSLAVLQEVLGTSSAGAPTPSCLTSFASSCLTIPGWKARSITSPCTRWSKQG